MAKINPIEWKKFEKFLVSQGCFLKRQEGSHRVYGKKGLKRPVILQVKGKVPTFIILNNLRTLGVDRDTYIQFLESK